MFFLKVLYIGAWLNDPSIKVEIRDGINLIFREDK